MSEVLKAVGHLKLNKAAECDGIQPEHIKYGGFTLSLYLSVAFTMFLRHSYVPRQFLTSYIVPIVKDRRGDTADTNNYLGISISSVVSKVLESVLMERLSSVVRTADQQFGFKCNHSCADCSFVLKSTIDYYLERGNSRMYVCALDLSKAYDRAPVYLVRLLSVWYANQKMRVKWKEMFLEFFSVGNGVRQGSVLSPSLFNVYLNELLIGLRSCGYGARIGHMYIGSVAYADDVTLLSPTLHGMQKMLDVCSLFAEEKGLIFNSKKSVSTVFVWNSRQESEDLIF